MCGRFGFAQSKEKVKKRFALKAVPEQLPLRFNIAPQQDIPVVLNDGKMELSYARWGLVPHWSKEEKFKLNLINAKAETIAEKPIFKGLLKSKRCLVLTDAFYEWQKKDGKKQPFRIFLKNEEPFAFAGIWDSWGEGDKSFNSCCIITTTPNVLVSSIHDRMPVILSMADEGRWLTETPLEEIPSMLKSYDDKLMQAYPISNLVNSPGNDSAELARPLV